MRTFLKHLDPLSLKWHVVAISAIVILRVITSYARQMVPFIMHHFWPLSVFTLSRPFAQDILVLGALFLCWHILERVIANTSINAIHLIILVCLLIGTNVLQGYKSGIIQPIVGHGMRDFTYWADTALLEHMGPMQFLRQYVTLQPTLSYHGRVHPPGPTVMLHTLHIVLGHPLYMSLFYAGVSLMTTLVIYRFLRLHYSLQTAVFGGILYALLPAFQIYGLASIDAVIALTSILAITSWMSSRRKDFWYSLSSIVATAALNYSVLWLLCTIGILSWKQDRTRYMKAVAILLVIYIAVYLLTGYDYLASLRVAAQFEGTTAGWYGFADPVSYLVTRIQGIVEPLVFLGPAMVGVIAQGLLSRKYGSNIGSASTIAFLTFLLAGAYYTGETARAALYCIPPLVIASAPILEQMSHPRRILLARLVITQAVFMQIVGYYSW